MNIRSCLLTMGFSALLATSPVLTAAPASAAPGSAECITAQTALRTQLGVAAVDIDLANQLRAAITELEAISMQLEPLYLEAELATQDELAEWDAAIDAEAEALQRKEDAAEEEQEDADRAYEHALQRRDSAAAAYESAAAAAYGTPGIQSLESRFDLAVQSFDDAFTRLGLTEGSDPTQLIALSDAALAACSAPAAVPLPAVRTAPALPRQQQGLNIQTAVRADGASAPTDLALLAGLAGFGAAAAGVVVLRRQGD